MESKKNRPLTERFNDAIQGIIFVVRQERNMRHHVVLSFLVILLATVLGVSRLELIALILTIGAVFFAELINTAVEELVNLITNDYHPLAAVIKNISAGAVLVAAATSVAVGYLIFIDYFLRLDGLVFRQVIPLQYLMVLLLATVVLVIISWKAKLGQEQLLRGGMPSGHTAIAFALAVSIWQTSQGLPIIAAFALAALVGQSRVEGKIHNWLEVVTGACVGSLIALVFFRLQA